MRSSIRVPNIKFLRIELGRITGRKSLNWRGRKRRGREGRPEEGGRKRGGDDSEGKGTEKKNNIGSDQIVDLGH